MERYKTLVDYVHNRIEYKDATIEEKRKIGLNLLGDYLQDTIAGRFIKEKSREPSVDIRTHVIGWFEQNKNLDFEMDREAVQIGFLAIHHI